MSLANPQQQSQRARRYRGLRVLKVLRTAALTPRMRRVTLGGEEIEGFGAGPNVKLMIPPASLAVPEWPLAGPDGRAIWPPDERRPVTRTYSLRQHRPDAGEIDIDFVLHGPHGMAARWAANAKPGDLIGVGGPGGLTVRAADWYLLAGDHTALPAIGAILEKLPGDARGEAFIEVPDADEQQALVHPPGITLNWLHRDPASEAPSPLIEAVHAAAWPQGLRPFVWVGCESVSVRAIRQYLREHRRLDRRHMLAIGYWRRGMSETAYHDAFNNDRDQDYYDNFRELMSK